MRSGVPHQENRPGREWATVSGMVRASVLYLPETGGCLRHMELSVPFTCQVEAPA